MNSDNEHDGGIDLFREVVLPAGWRKERLGNLCTIRRGSSPRPIGDQRYFVGGTIPWIKIGDVTATGTRFVERTAEHVNEVGAERSVKIPPGSLIIANSGVSLGFAAITRVEGCIHDGWLLISDFNGVDRNYLFYWVNYATSKLRGLADGTTQPNLNTGLARSLRIPLPPLTEQKAIADLLWRLDDKIELNRRMNATLEAMARALFQSWFVDFDPVRAKAAGQTPAGMDPATASLFASELEDSELGEIPRGWKLGSVLVEASLLSGGTPKTSEQAYWEGDIPWASAKDVSQCGQAFLIETERAITRRGLDESSTKMIPALATVVVARGATTGRLTMFGHEIAMNQTCYALHSKDGTPYYAYCHAKHFIESMVNAAHGSVFDTITTSTFETTAVLLAPIKIRQAFDLAVGPLFRQILANLHQSRTLAALRDALLPKLLSGEIKL